ncbi:hypothetical protein GCM10010321_81450 [Streptomyces chartreusis]|nr:hypothetical protein GCM10010321_81450 [Streptomyces chartreusis]
MPPATAAVATAVEARKLLRLGPEEAEEAAFGVIASTPLSKRFDVAARLSERPGVHKSRFQDSSRRLDTHPPVERASKRFESAEPIHRKGIPT